ncbi:hypothetical protein MKY96_32915 [Paenibacillus sp. FSL R7-0302]|uniref:hypothetical protein n=1 Tax=Paenibacillus sp. FSL R7-0302 TaxID=2921681 RepID=UPI0030F539EC
MKLIIEKNWEYGEDGVYTRLVNANTTQVIMEGDWYHDKIDERIDGFFTCLNHLCIPHDIERVVLNKDNEGEDE